METRVGASGERLRENHLSPFQMAPVPGRPARQVPLKSIDYAGGPHDSTLDPAASNSAGYGIVERAGVL